MNLLLSGTVVTVPQPYLLNNEQMPPYNLHCNMDLYV